MKEKHEEVIREIIKDITVNINETVLTSILSKHYDPEPELKAGMWYKIPTGELRFFVSNEVVLDIKGYNKKKISEKDAIACNVIAYIPHTFTESDLELLNTDEVKYRLYQVTDDSFYVKARAKVEGVAYETFRNTYTLPTIHEAVKSAFNAVTAENVLKGMVKK